MSELINNSIDRKELLKHMILQLHEGIAPEEIKKRLIEMLQKIPYGEVVEVKQELIREGLPETEILRLCDVHSQAPEGEIFQHGKFRKTIIPMTGFKAQMMFHRKGQTNISLHMQSRTGLRSLYIRPKTPAFDDVFPGFECSGIPFQPGIVHRKMHRIHSAIRIFLSSSPVC